MDEKEIAALDPGIRDVVRRLNDAGFVTTDSGDGVSKVAEIASGEALSVPHVACRTALHLMVFHADQIAALLGPAWHVEASYCANDHSVLILVTGVSERLRADQHDWLSAAQAKENPEAAGGLPAALPGTPADQ